MVRIVTLFIFIAISLTARENPFFPPKDIKSPSYTTNHITKTPPFLSKSFRLPSSARILKSITITYENLDGSISSKEIPINKAVDWHKEMELSYKRANRFQSKKKRKKSTYTKIGSLRFIVFYCGKNRLKIVTKDKLLRDFKLVKPDRIVLDFKRNADFRTYMFQGVQNFKKVTIGNHSGYYRAVIELDGRYVYKVKKEKDGYTLQLF